MNPSKFACGCLRYAPALRLLAAAALSLVALFLVGCAHPAAPIRLPSTAAVARPLAAATTHTAKATASNVRADQLAQAAVKSGLAAGSAQAQELAVDTRDTGNELAQVNLQLGVATTAVDQLTLQLRGDQKQIDTLAAHDKVTTARLVTTAALLKTTVSELATAQKALAAARWHTIEGDLFINLGFLAAIAIAGAGLETLLRAALSAALSLLAAGWHLALGCFLRFWPLLLAAI